MPTFAVADPFTSGIIVDTPSMMNVMFPVAPCILIVKSSPALILVGMSTVIFVAGLFAILNFMEVILEL